MLGSRTRTCTPVAATQQNVTLLLGASTGVLASVVRLQAQSLLWWALDTATKALQAAYGSSASGCSTNSSGHVSSSKPATGSSGAYMHRDKPLEQHQAASIICRAATALLQMTIGPLHPPHTSNGALGGVVLQAPGDTSSSSTGAGAAHCSSHSKSTKKSEQRAETTANVDSTNSTPQVAAAAAAEYVSWPYAALVWSSHADDDSGTGFDDDFRGMRVSGPNLMFEKHPGANVQLSVAACVCQLRQLRQCCRAAPAGSQAEQGQGAAGARSTLLQLLMLAVLQLQRQPASLHGHFLHSEAGGMLLEVLCVLCSDQALAGGGVGVSTHGTEQGHQQPHLQSFGHWQNRSCCQGCCCTLCLGLTCTRSWLASSATRPIPSQAAAQPTLAAVSRGLS
jgi:hypothetical protein